MAQFTFRTSPPATYIPPSREEMGAAAKAIGLAGFAPDLVADICNLGTGGAVNPPSRYRDAVWAREEQKLPAPDHRGEWTASVLRDGQKVTFRTSDRAEAVGARAGEAMRYHQNVCDFLQAIDLGKFPGSSPLEQAMACLKLLSKQKGGEASGDEGGEPLPIFTENSSPEGVAKSLHEAMDMAESLSEEELDLVDPDGENHEVEKIPEGDGSPEGGSKGLKALKIAEDLAPGSDKRVMLDISRKLDQFTKLQARRQVRQEQDPAGEEIRQRPIRHLGELHRVAPSAWATRQENPGYFLYQAVSGQLPVRERVTRVERKQAIFILIDGSGSMRGRKHWKATGVVMNRLKAVISGDAEVFVSVFDTTMGRVEHASTPEEARELVKKFAKGNFTGGGTDIAGAVRAAHVFIEKVIAEGAALYRPEVIVLTDEDSSITGLKRSEIPGTTVHGFAMEVANPSLVAFARSTGGVGVDRF